MSHIYFAAPLFAESERLYNEHLVQQIRSHYPEHTIYLPQEAGEINDKNAYADSKMIAQYDAEAVLKSDLLIAVLDGLAVDPGVASEIGIAYQAGIPVLGLYTDSRQQGADNPQKLAALQEVGESQFSYVNLFTVGIIKLNGHIVTTSNSLLTAIGDYLS